MRFKFNVTDRNLRPAPARGAFVLAAALLAGLLTACQSVQTTQAGQVGVTRTQLMGVSAEEINAASNQAYKKMLQDAEQKKQLNVDAAMVARVRGIAKRLIPQTAHFRQDAVGWRWETNVFHSDEVNAFCMAGGKIGVYSGLVDKLKITDDELAAVMGHEIAHALREHVREQVSRQQAAKLPGVVLAIVTGNQALADLGDMVTDVTLTLPKSREAEREADEIAASGPLTAWVSGSFVSQATLYHSKVGKLILIVLVALHVAAVVYYLWRKGENLARPMLTGDKELPEGIEPSRDDRRTRLVAAAVLAAAVGFVLLLLKYAPGT